MRILIWEIRAYIHQYFAETTHPPLGKCRQFSKKPG